MLRPLTKKQGVRRFSDGQHDKGSRTLVKSSWEHFYHIFTWLLGEIISRKSPWLKFEIIGVLFNTWTVDYKYPVPDCETKKHPVRAFFDGQHVNGSRTLVKSSSEHFYHIFPSLWGEMISRKSPWLKSEITEVFVDTWTVDYNYPVPDCENLPCPIQMQLS